MDAKNCKTIATKENGISDLMENIKLHKDYINNSDILTKKYREI